MFNSILILTFLFMVNIVNCEEPIFHKDAQCDIFGLCIVSTILFSYNLALQGGPFKLTGSLLHTMQQRTGQFEWSTLYLVR